MRTSSPLTAGLAVSAALLLTLSACGSGSEPGGGDPNTVRLGISPFQDTMLPIIGQEKGWFEEEGLNVELKTLAWNTVTPSVASGSVDVAINNTTGLVSVAEATDDMVYAYGFNPFTEGSALVARPGSNLTTYEDAVEKGQDEERARTEVIEQLRGKTVVTTNSTDMGKALDLALESVGMSTDDVTVIDMDPDQGLAAFLSGTGDAYIGGAPQRARAVADGSPVLLAGPDLAPPPINGWVTTDSYLDDHEDKILKLTHVMHRIFRYCDAETEACGKIITDRLNKETGSQSGVKDFVDAWQKIELYAPNAAAVKKWVLDEDGVAYWKRTWDGDNDYLTRTGALGSPVDPEKHFAGEKVWRDYVDKYGAHEEGY